MTAGSSVVTSMSVLMSGIVAGDLVLTSVHKHTQKQTCCTRHIERGSEKEIV